MSGMSSKAHDLFSTRLYVPFSRLERRLMPARRPVMRAYDEGLKFRGSSRTWSDEQKRCWILQRLRVVARKACNETPYYRDLFRDAGFDPFEDFTFEDFGKVPVLDRSDVQRAGRSIINQKISPDQLMKDSTGGSTGRPTEVWLGPEERGWRESAKDWVAQRLGVAPGARTALLWGHHLDPVKSDSLRDRYYFFATNTRWFDCFRLSPERLENYDREFTRFNPACIIAYASAMGSLAEHLADRGLRAAYPSGCMITGAEKLLTRHREAIEHVFAAPVHERYGGRDVGCIGFQPNPKQSLQFEVDWANVLVEPETADPESPVLITKLHADGMPMIRYRIGDVARFAEPKPGHPVLMLEEVLGREADRIWLPDGRWIHGLQFPHMLKDYPVQEFMFLQRSDYSVDLKIIPKGPFRQEARNGIIDVVSSNLPGIPLRLELVKELPLTKASKRRPVISEVEEIQRRLAS